MPSPRLTLAALAFALACAPKQPEPKQPAPEQQLPKPNIDPGRLPSKERDLSIPSTDSGSEKSYAGSGKGPSSSAMPMANRFAAWA